MLTRWSVKVFCKACTDLKFASNIPADHIDENASQICQICVRDWETGKVIWEIAQPWAPNLMAHKWWNVFRSRWGMKEPIKRPLDSGIGKVSAQRYPSVQQHRGEQSVFICPCHAGRHGEGNEGGLTSVTPKLGAEIYWGSGQFQIWEQPLDCFSQYIKSRLTWGSLSNLQVLGPAVERLLWLAWAWSRCQNCCLPCRKPRPQVLRSVRHSSSHSQPWTTDDFLCSRSRGQTSRCARRVTDLTNVDI